MVSSGGRCERQATVHRSCFRRLPCLHWQPRSTEALSKLGKSDTILPHKDVLAASPQAQVMKLYVCCPLPGQRGRGKG